MPTKSVSIIILRREAQKILLHQREDFRVWSLPGGRIEPGETWTDAAIREAHEETGYHIGIDRLVGEYRRPQMPAGGDLTYVALAHVLADEPEAFGWETVAVRWFPVTALPPSLLRFGRIYVADALSAHSTPVERTLCIPWWQAGALRLLFWLRSLRNRLFKRP